MTESSVLISPSDREARKLCPNPHLGHCICLHNHENNLLVRHYMGTTALHEPRLDTILMIEAAILRAKSYPTKKKLWQSLPRKIQYQTFNRILQYLEGSNKILIDKDGGIVWTFANNPKLKSLLQSSIMGLVTD